MANEVLFLTSVIHLFIIIIINIIRIFNASTKEKIIVCFDESYNYFKLNMQITASGQDRRYTPPLYSFVYVSDAIRGG